MSGVKKNFEGSQKLEIRKEKEYNNCKNAKLDNLLISASTSSCTSNSNAREPDEQILEVKINPQEKKTHFWTLQLIRLLYIKQKESEGENEETYLNRSDFAHFVGTPIDTDIREQILKVGLCQPEGNFQKDAKIEAFHHLIIVSYPGQDKRSNGNRRISSTISGFFCWVQSKVRTRRDAGFKGQSLQDGCKLFAFKFFCETQKQGHKQAEKPITSSYS
ncbi:hypothetical protein TNCV_3847701 [Trichonephila clavipes]|nr:hypothetical protein TNCV_3847701 [Trichonephila clavipes]